MYLQTNFNIGKSPIYIIEVEHNQFTIFSKNDLYILFDNNIEKDDFYNKLINSEYIKQEGLIESTKNFQEKQNYSKIKILNYKINKGNLIFTSDSGKIKVFLNKNIYEQIKRGLYEIGWLKFKKSDITLHHILCNSQMLKIAELFFNEPEKFYFLEELFQKTRLSQKIIMKYLEDFSKKGIILAKGKKDSKYIANIKSNEYITFKKIINLSNIYDSGIIKKINDECASPLIILFGKYSQGKDSKKDDINLYIQAKKSEIDLSLYEKMLKKNIYLLFNEDFDSCSKELKNMLINGIILKGHLEAFK